MTITLRILESLLRLQLPASPKAPSVPARPLKGIRLPPCLLEQAQDASRPALDPPLPLAPLPATLAPASSCLKVGDSPTTLPCHLALPASRTLSKSLLLALAAFSTGLTQLSRRPASHSLPLSSCGIHSEASPAAHLGHAYLQQLCSHSCLYPPRPAHHSPLCPARP